MWVGTLGVGLRGGLEGPEEGVTEAPDVARLAVNYGGKGIHTSAGLPGRSNAGAHRIRRHMPRGCAVPKPGERSLLPTAIAFGAGAPFNPTPRNPQRLTHLPDDHAVQPATGRRARNVPRCLTVTSPVALMNKTG